MVTYFLFFQFNFNNFWKFGKAQVFGTLFDLDLMNQYRESILKFNQAGLKFDVNRLSRELPFLGQAHWLAGNLEWPSTNTAPHHRLSVWIGKSESCFSFEWEITTSTIMPTFTSNFFYDKRSKEQRIKCRMFSSDFRFE